MDVDIQDVLVVVHSVVVVVVVVVVCSVPQLNAPRNYPVYVQSCIDKRISEAESSVRACVRACVRAVRVCVCLSP